jgi:Domain of unknown function (DUF4276)
VSRRIAIATEGPSSQAVLRALCSRVGAVAEIRYSIGKPRLKKDFDKLFRSMRGPFDAYLVVPDLQPATDCSVEAHSWRTEIDRRFSGARLCLSIWETESWLLADPDAVRASLGATVRAGDPEAVGGVKPSDVLADAISQSRGYRRGSAYDKERDGTRVVVKMDLEVARTRSSSLDRFLRFIT